MSELRISHIELVALKKLALVVGALADSFKDYTAKTETRALLKVLMEIINRAEFGT